MSDNNDNEDNDNVNKDNEDNDNEGQRQRKQPQRRQRQWEKRQRQSCLPSRLPYLGIISRTFLEHLVSFICAFSVNAVIAHNLGDPNAEKFLQLFR